MFSGTDELGRKVPSGLIEQEQGVVAGRDLARDFGKMHVHRLGVAEGQDESRALALARADGAKDIGRGCALIGRRRRPRAAPRPAPRDLVLLANSGLVGEPDFYLAGIDAFLLRDGLQTRGKTFLKSSIASSAWA
jgi:hypothetical protein